MTKYIKPLIIVLLTVAGLFVIQCTVNLIPQSAIVDNIIESINDVNESGIELNRVRVIPGYYAATDDRPGDFAWLQIIYNVDSKHPVRSTIEARRYTEYTRFHEELEKQINEGLEPNDTYSRYWHGMTMILRPMLTLFSLTQIKALLSIVIISLWVLAFIKCGKFRVTLIIGFMLGSGFTSVLSVEYMPVFIITPITLIVLSCCKKIDYCVIMTLVGVLTAYFDFLTAETLTITLPLLYLIWKGKDWKAPALHWCIGYGITMGIRVVTSFVINDMSITLILGDKFSINKRPSTLYDGTSGLMKAIRVLIPGEEIYSVPLATCLVLAVVILAGYICVNYNSKFGIRKLLSYLVVAFIPIVRLLILDGHAYTHAEFACRALIGTFVAVSLIIYETILYNRKGVIS